MRTMLLLWILSFSAFAAPATEYYWQMGRTLTGKGAHTSVLVIGKREYPQGTNTKVDTQLYFSADEGPAEYSYVFHEDTKKLEVLKEGAVVGTGTFQCDAKKRCSYKYEIPNAYSAEGTDIPVNKNGVLYKESSKLTYPGGGKADLFTADYLTLDEAAYQKVRKQVVGK